MLDAFTEKHLDAWLERTVRDDLRAEVRAKMLALLAEDELGELPELGWPRVREMAVGW